MVGRMSIPPPEDLEEILSELSEESVKSGGYERYTCFRNMYFRFCACSDEYLMGASTVVNKTVLTRMQSAKDCVDHRVRCTIKCSQLLLDTVRTIQKIHDKVTLASSLRTRCLTGDIPGSLFDKIPQQYRVKNHITLGGMSRIYTASSTSGTEYIMKITDTSKSLGGHEMKGYKLLQQHDIPSARVEFHTCIDTYHVTVIEKLECTLTTLILAISTTKGFSPLIQSVIGGLECLLALLEKARVTFVDLTTDNIMCRLSDDQSTLELVLIDPQFVVPMDTLALKLGKAYAENIDRIHVCMKLLGVSRLKTSDVVVKHANTVCKQCLGYVPDIHEVVDMLTKRVPGVVRTAYGLLETKKMSSNTI